MEAYLRWVTGISTHRTARFRTSRAISPVKSGVAVPRLKLYKQDDLNPQPKWRCDSVEVNYIVTGFGKTAELAYLNWAVACRLKRSHAATLTNK